MKEYLNDVRMVGQGDGARNHLNKKKSEALEHGGACNIQGVFIGPESDHWECLSLTP